MAEINDLNVTDASNTARAPEGMAPSAVNDGIRALEGLLARGLKDTIDGVITTAGTSTAYTAAANRTLSAYYTGLELTLKFNAASGASPTLNVDSLGAKNLVWPDGTAVAANDIPADALAKVKYDGTSFQVLTPIEPPSTLTASSTTTLTNKTIDGDDNTVQDLAITSIKTDAGNADKLFGRNGSGVAGHISAGSNITISGGSISATQPSAASQAEQETGTSTTTFVSPGRQIFNKAACKGWATFSGGTTPAALQRSFNVSSLTDNDTGDYTVNWGTDFSSAEYAVLVTVQTAVAGNAPVSLGGVENGGQLAGSVQIQTGATTTGALGDMTRVYVAAFGDLV